MRIVAGEWRGRHLAVPRAVTRPTADRVREAWMSIVHPLLADARVLDLCAGSGALGLEALSRGARHATFVDTSERALRTLRKNVEMLGAGERVTIARTDAIRFLTAVETVRYDVAFVDPPYATDIGRRVALRWMEQPFATLLGVEHSARETLPGSGDTRRYGDTAITFYRIADPIASHSPG